MTPEIEALRDVILWAIEAEEGREYKARMMKAPAFAKARKVLREHGLIMPEQQPPGRCRSFYTTKG